MSGGATLRGYALPAAFRGAAFRAVFLADVFATFLALLTTVLLVDPSSTGRSFTELDQSGTDGSDASCSSTT